MKKSIGIDLGGTNIKGVLMSEDSQVLESFSVPTSDYVGHDWKKGIKVVYEHLEKLNGGPADALGLSAPGLANEENSAIAYLPNRLDGLENFKWGEYLGRTSYLINDAHAALMAEAKFGALKKYKNALMLTLGTGVGGGVLINGELYQGMFQRAGHFGHVAVNVAGDDLSILGIPGSLEYAIGNYSVKKRTHGLFENTRDLVDAYLKNDTVAAYFWLDSVRKLAINICSLINAYSPEAIAISGGIVLAGDALFKPLSDFVKVYEFNPFGKSTPILKSIFDDQAGAIGAAAYALTKS